MEASTKNMFKCLGLRFSRGFIATFVSSMIVFLQSGDLSTSAFIATGMAGLAGGFMALDKYFRTQEWYDNE